MTEIKASVLMITYNHEKFISQAIDSVLMQRTKFDYELVIGDDYSTDKTGEIVISKYNDNPDIIKVLSTSFNMGTQKNFIRTLNACQGQYVAILEGDDYWTSPDKLAKQVFFLDTHPECSICFHNAYVVNENGEVIKEAAWAGQERISTIRHLVAHNFMTNCSVMFRRGLFDTVPDNWYKLKNSDWLFHILNAQHGMIGFIDEIMAAYRKHPQGVWTRLSNIEVLQARLLGYLTINNYLNYEYDDISKPLIKQHWDWLEDLYIEIGYEIGKNELIPQSVFQIFSDWPTDLPLPKKWKYRVFAQVFERLLFLSYSEHNYASAKYCLFKVARYDILRLKNKGIWSMVVEMYLGYNFSGWFHKLSKVVKHPLSYLHLSHLGIKRQK